MNKKKRRLIQKLKVSKEERLEIMREIGLCEVAVFNALRYSTNSEKAQAVRDYAINVLGHKPFKVEDYV